MVMVMVMPKLGANAYMRIFDPDNVVCPRPDRIIQDAHKVVNVCKEIHKDRGVYIPILAGGCMVGHQYTATAAKTSKNHGDKRDREEYSVALDELSMHTDLKALLSGGGDITDFFQRPAEDDDVGASDADEQ